MCALLLPLWVSSSARFFYTSASAHRPHGPPPSSANATSVDVNVSWSGPSLRTVRTSAQIEVDVMPFLGRTSEGGDFNGYYAALQNLGAEFVRFSPWFGCERRPAPLLLSVPAAPPAAPLGSLPL